MVEVDGSRGGCCEVVKRRRGNVLEGELPA